MIRFLILSGYFELMMYLMASGKLNQYINVHYSYLAEISMVLALFLSVVQLINWVKASKQKHRNSPKMILKNSMSYLLLALPLFVCLFLPYESLDASVVNNKGFVFPLSKESGTSDDGTTVQYLKPNTSSYFTKSDYDDLMKKTLKTYQNSSLIEVTEKNYMEVMELIYDYPSEFIGKKIRLTGFVYNNASGEQNYHFLFRFGIIHCIADSGVFGLMIQTNQDYKDNTWLSVEGTIISQFFDVYKRNIPAIQVDQAQEVDQPSNPYVYRSF
ncbi:TIGR03943 family protein [Streptococcaceae bacterium ESL0687]|nr:TIGR03943 family protein [Streptococcaceae bacterium ESL0687]